jgi:hypothetical protein
VNREHGRLLIDTHEAGTDDEVDDLPRNSQGTALIADPRNDENLLICQVHLAFLHFANRVLEEFLDHTVQPEDRSRGPNEPSAGTTSGCSSTSSSRRSSARTWSTAYS